VACAISRAASPETLAEEFDGAVLEFASQAGLIAIDVNLLTGE
jgi:hypothetical protein